MKQIICSNHYLFRNRGKGIQGYKGSVLFDENGIIDVSQFHLIRQEYYSDITVFDGENIKESATVEKSNTYSEGIKYVFVNGAAVVENGNLNVMSRAGKIV